MNLALMVSGGIWITVSFNVVADRHLASNSTELAG